MRNCLKCGAEVYGKYCPECGAEFVENTESPCVETEAADAPVTVTKDREKTKKVCNTVSTVFFLLSAVVGLVFAFFCGVSLVSNGKVIETGFVFDYFGVEYKDLETLKEFILYTFNWSTLGTKREIALEFPVVLGTIFAVVGVLGTYTFFGITAYNTYRKYVKHVEVNVKIPAIATYFGFVMIATVMLNMNAMETSGTKTVPYMPTLVGLIMGAVFLGIGLIINTVANFDRKAYGIKDIILWVIVVALVVTALVFTTMPAFSIKVVMGGSVLIDMEAGLFAGAQGMLVGLGNTPQMFKLLDYGLAGGVFGVAIIVILLVVLFRKVLCLCNGQKKYNVILCSVALVLACVYLAMSAVFADLAVKQYGVTSDSLIKIEKFYLAPILVLAMTALSLITEAFSKL